MMKQKYYPPENPEDFESLCMQLMGKLWDISGVSKYGRRGHAQAGVDFFGTVPKGVYGGQAKLREATNPLSDKEIIAEIEKAKKFTPTLSVYVILTSTKRDPSLQKFVAKKNQELLLAGFFSVEIRFWDDINELLETYTDVRDAVFGGLPAEATARIERKLDVIGENVQHLATATAVEFGDFHEDIDAAVKRTQDNQPDEALGILLLLRRQKWEILNNRQKYRVLANIGHALTAKEEFRDAAEYFIKAKSFQPKDIKARCLEALGQYNLGQQDLAFNLIDKVCRDDPDLPFAAAIWAQCAPYDMPFSEIESSITAAVHKDGDVALSLAIRGKRAGELERAEFYARAAVADVPKAWRLREELAGILLEQELRRGRHRFGPRSKLTNPGKLQEIADLLEKAIQMAPTAISSRSLARMHLNLALALEILGRKEDAAQEIERAVAACPRDADVSLRHAFLLYEQGHTNRAIKELLATEQHEPTVPAVLMLAQLLAERNKGEDRAEAIAVLDTHLAKLTGIPDYVQTDYVETLVDLLCKDGRKDEAKGLVETLDAKLLPDVGRNILRIMTLRESDNRAEAVEQARQLVPEFKAKGHWTNQRRLAMLCQSLGLHKEGLSLWQEVVNPETAGPDVLRVLSCAYEVSDDTFILDFCQRLRQNGVYDSQCLDLEVAKLNEYNQSDDAILAIQEFLAHNASDEKAPSFRVHLSLIGIQKEKPELITKDPALLPKAATVAPKLGSMVVKVLRYGAGPDEAVRYAYELFRENPNALEAHLAVIDSFGMLVGPKPTLADPAEVEPGAAVFYQETESEIPKWLIVEDLPNPRQELHEYAVTHPHATAMIGCHCGETFVLRKHSFQDRKATIKQIQSKYVRRFQDCLSRLEDRFPEETPIWQFSLTKNEKGDPDFSPIFRSIDKKHNTVQEMLVAYRQHPMPLHVLGHAVGCSVFDSIRALANIRDTNTKTCRGTQEEFDRTIADLNTCNAIILDESAIATLFILGMEDFLQKFPIPLVVSEGTLQAIRDLDTLHADINREGGVLTKCGEGYQLVSASPEAIAAEKKRLQRLICIVEKACRVEGGAVLAKLDKDTRKKLVTVAGRPAAESLYLSASAGRVLWTEDICLGDFAKAECGVARTWTQAVFFWATEKGFFSPEQMTTVTLGLLGKGYLWTRMNSNVVRFAAIESDWNPKQAPLSDAFHHFADPNAEIISLMLLTVRSFVEILKHAPSGKASYLMSCILDKLGTREGGGICAQAILYEASELKGRPDPERIAEKIELVVGTWFENCRKSGIRIN
ncbi:MAG: hypothetical protein K8S55_04600 [Phycisphaerae bacterium]|nr:hypothetical protein [Phycisphaerae bacterium]